MKKLVTVIAFLLLGTITQAQAQETKKIFIVFETQPFTVLKYENGKDVWRPEIPYKKYVRIIIAPFDAPSKIHSSNGLRGALSNQLAEFVYTKHLERFEKLKLHNAAFNFSIIDYDPEVYGRRVKDCDDCNYQHEKTIIDGFTFEVKEEFKFSEYYKNMQKFITGKK